MGNSLLSLHKYMPSISKVMGDNLTNNVWGEGCKQKDSKKLVLNFIKTTYTYIIYMEGMDQ